MTGSRFANRLLTCGLVLTAFAGLVGCSAPAESDASAPENAAAASPSASSTPATQMETSADDGYAALCGANRAAAAAKGGTVGEDLKAVTAQAETIRALLPLHGVSAEIAKGAETFAESAEQDAAILAQFPADSLVSDVGLDPKFTQSEAVQKIAHDPNYQAFLVWTMQTCGLG